MRYWRFWLATFDVPGRTGGKALPAQPILASGAHKLAVEVIWEDGSDELGVLVSKADDLYRGVLTCCIGFANGTNKCRIWRDRGFPLIDARIWRDNGIVKVAAPYFGPRARRLEFAESLLEIEGVDFGPPAGAPLSTDPKFAQMQWSPDYTWPGRLVAFMPVEWKPARENVHRRDDVTIGLTARPARNPSLIPLERGGSYQATVWTGDMSLTRGGYSYGSGKPIVSNRVDMFGAPAFRFEDVEVIGFRLDVGGVQTAGPLAGRAMLDHLVEDLNFHLRHDPADPIGMEPDADFRYRVATPTIVFELLRYGKMKLRAPWAPLDILDYQSQHEFVVRLLVGRVDDDSAQAHSPAVYVPAIFVDNPWSKVLGRDLQGFDKWLAHFCVPKDNGAAAPRPRPPELRVLQMDGHLPGKSDPQPESLDRIAKIVLATRMGVTQPGGSEPALVEVRYSEMQDPRPAFMPIDVDLALNTSALALTRWRRGDFGDPEFRRAFARAVIGSTVRGFRSVQVSPVGDRNTRVLRKTWITGSFALDNEVRVAPTLGVASLKIHHPSGAPRGWQKVCNLLQIPQDDWQEFSFPAGSWYRMKFSMDLTIDNALE